MKHYRVHIHDHADQGRWLAQQDFDSRPSHDDILGAFPVLAEAGRYEVRIVVVQFGEEHLLSSWLQDGFTWPAGKKFGELSPGEKKAAARQAGKQLEAELTEMAPAIERVLAEPDVEVAAADLATEDKHGPPYVVPMGYRLDYAGAVAIARSKHPSRVLANTNGYRFGRFTEVEGIGGTEVQVHLMGSHIATFTPEGVFLWWRGWVTVSSTEAMNNLCSGGWFYTDKGKIMRRGYGSPSGSEREAREGDLYPYRITT